MATGVAFRGARRARIVPGRSTATWFCTHAHRGPMWSRGDTRPATGYRLRGLATRPLTPLHRDTTKRKKKKYPRETSASPEDRQATARPKHTLGCVVPPRDTQSPPSPVTPSQQISPGSLTGLGLGTRTGEERPLGSTTQSSPIASICCVAPGTYSREVLGRPGRPATPWLRL